MPSALLDVLYQGLRTFYIIGIPIIVVLSVTSAVVTIFQSALGVREESISFAARLIALLLLLYAFLPRAADSLIVLAQFAYR